MRIKCFEALQKHRERFGSSKACLSSLLPPEIFYRPFLEGTTIVVLQCYMLFPCVYGHQEYGHLNNSCPLYFMFVFIL